MSDITAEANQKFQPVDSLPQNLIHASLQVMNFSGKYLNLEEGKEHFDWQGFKDAVTNYTGGDLSFDKYNKSTINQESQEAGVMAEKVAKFLNDAFDATIDTTKLVAVILNTFTNLKEVARGSSYMEFSTDSKKKNSSWQYRMLFSVPFGNSPEYFYSLVITLIISADEEDESSWWGMTSSTKKNFSVQIDALELVVGKGFKAPHAW